MSERSTYELRPAPHKVKGIKKKPPTMVRRSHVYHRKIVADLPRSDCLFRNFLTFVIQPEHVSAQSVIFAVEMTPSVTYCHF